MSHINGVGETATAAPVGSTRAITRSVYGASVQKRPLYVYTRGAADAPRNVLVVGCLHGDECAGNQLLRKLRKQSVPAGVRLWIIMSANPDGTRAGSRHNARRVDLNRNFPFRWRRAGKPGYVYYPGRRRASEPETRALMALISRVRPDVSIWYHQHMNAVDSTGRRRRFARLYARSSRMRLQRLPRFRGTATSWQNHRFANSSAFVVELPAGNMRRRAVRSHLSALKAIARALR